MILSTNTKNSIAKVVVLLWIILLIIIAMSAARFAITFNINQYFGFQGDQQFANSIVLEVRVIILMFAVSITGGISFLIKDFYRANKYANMYEVFYADYKSKQISFDEFQHLATFEIYTGKFNHTWVYWFLVQPILSSFLGLIAFSIARSGLGVLQGSSAVAAEITIQNIYLYGVFTFLAGFSSHKFIDWLDRLADKVFSITLPEKVQQEKESLKQTSMYERTNLKDTIHEVIVTTDWVDSPMESDKIVPQNLDTGFETVKLETAPNATTSKKTVALKSIR